MTNKEKLLKVLNETKEPLYWAEILKLSGMDQSQMGNAVKAANSKGLILKEDMKYSLKDEVKVGEEEKPSKQSLLRMSFYSLTTNREKVSA